MNFIRSPPGTEPKRKHTTKWLRSNGGVVITWEKLRKIGHKPAPLSLFPPWTSYEVILGLNPKENIQHTEHGESLKSRIQYLPGVELWFSGHPSCRPVTIVNELSLIANLFLSSQWPVTRLGSRNWAKSWRKIGNAIRHFFQRGVLFPKYRF